MSTTDTAEARPRQITYLPLDEVPPAPRNPKLHDIDALRASIEEFGFVTPGVIDARTGLTVVGHGRTEVLRTMHAGGEAPPAGVVLDREGRWLVPFVTGWSSTSDAHAEKFLIADNRHAELGGWDNDLLTTMLTELPDLDGTGYDLESLGALVAAMGDPDDEHDDDGETGDGAAARGELLGLAGLTLGEPDITASRGQVWQLGEHVLVVADPHKDWRSFVAYLGGGQADCVLWPYPSPLAPLVADAGRRFVLVQPNTYLAGWLLTKWARVTQSPPILADDGGGVSDE